MVIKNFGLFDAMITLWTKWIDRYWRKERIRSLRPISIFKIYVVISSVSENVFVPDARLGPV